MGTHRLVVSGEKKEPMDINTAMKEFTTLMMAKFIATEYKHPGHSVIYDGIDSLSLEEISEHFMQEFLELYEAESPEANQVESIDVANMAFLTWWKYQSIRLYESMKEGLTNPL